MPTRRSRAAAPAPGTPEPASAPPQLVLCRGCRQYVWQATVTCPHCGGDVPSLEAKHAKLLRVARKAQARVERLLEALGSAPPGRRR